MFKVKYIFKIFYNFYSVSSFEFGEVIVCWIHIAMNSNVISVAETDTFKSFQNKKQYKINHTLNCNDKCLVHLLPCKICGLHYKGSTTNPFRYCWNNYKDNNRKAERGLEHMQADLFEHFASNGHNSFLEDYTITLLIRLMLQVPIEEKNIGEGY